MSSTSSEKNLEGRGRRDRRRREEQARTYPLTAVVPARNAQATLPACLQALSAGRPSQLSVIVVDDGSRDETASCAADFQGRLEIEVLRRERSEGPAAARNLGWRSCDTPYVLFLDADVILPAQSIDWIRESLDLYAHRPEVAGILGTYAAEIPFPDAITNYKNLYICHLYRSTETVTPYLHTPICCIRRSVLEEAGGFDGRLATAEDFHLSLALASKGYHFVIDRRVAGVHLKRYTFRSLLAEDWRRIRDLLGMPVEPGQRRFFWKAQRWNRLLSVGLAPLAAAVSAAALFVPAAWRPAALGGAGLLGLLFLLLHGKFLRFCARRRGWLFSGQAALLLWLEMGWAAAAGLWLRLFSRRPTERGSAAPGP